MEPITVKKEFKSTYLFQLSPLPTNVGLMVCIFCVEGAN